MVFTNVTNPRSHVSRKDEYKTTLVLASARQWAPTARWSAVPPSGAMRL